MRYAKHYFERAVWAYTNAINDKLSLDLRGHLIAIAVHACQSLKESLDQFSEENPGDSKLAEAIKGLPHTEVIENVRNMDLHGHPLPICDPDVQTLELVAKPDKPIKLTSSHGVPVSLVMPGVAPEVHNPNRKHANVKMGGATVSIGCDHGKLIVHDFSTDKNYMLLGVIKTFLRECQTIMTNRSSEPSDGAPSTAPQDGVNAVSGISIASVKVETTTKSADDELKSTDKYEDK